MEVLKVKPCQTVEGIALSGAGLRLYIDPGDPGPVVFELLCDDLALTRQTLRNFGFQEISWQGHGALNLVVDPYEIRWNIYEDRSALPYKELDPSDEALLLPKIGIVTHLAPKAAAFYAEVLAEPLTTRSDCFIIDSGPMRLRVQGGLPEGPNLWLPNEFDLQTISPTAKKSYAIDENGVCWRKAGKSNKPHAVVSLEARK